MIFKNIFFLLIFILGIGLVYSDSNGVWHNAKDVRGGIFASDEDEKDFSFPGLVTFNNNAYFMSDVGIGTTSPSSKLDVMGNINVSSIYDRENNAYYVNPASTSVLNNLKVDGPITSPEGTLRDDNGGWIRTYGNTGWFS